MRVAAISGGKLESQERPDLVPGEGQILIRVRAAGINGADLAQRAGIIRRHATRRRTSPGSSAPARWRAVGPNAFRFRSAIAWWRCSEAAAMRSRPWCTSGWRWPCRMRLDWPAAGGFTEVFATAHDALFTQASLAPGERLLVNGAAGGVGLAAVQLGVSLGARVTAGARHKHGAAARRSAPTPMSPEPMT